MQWISLFCNRNLGEFSGKIMKYEVKIDFSKKIKFLSVVYCCLEGLLRQFLLKVNQLRYLEGKKSDHDPEFHQNRESQIRQPKIPKTWKIMQKIKKFIFFKNVYYTTGDVSGGCYEGFRVFKSSFPMIIFVEHFLRIFLLESDQKIWGILGIFGNSTMFRRVYLRAQGEFEALTTCVVMPLTWSLRIINFYETIFCQKKVTGW